MLIRPTTPADVPHLVPLADRTGVFKPLEIETLHGVFRDYFAEAHDEEGHRCFTAENDGAAVGFVYIAPVEMTVGAWELWWIAVDKARHGRGLGAELLRFAEAYARDYGGTIMTLDTSSIPSYDATQAFYLKHGYAEAGRIPDFYCEGDGKVLFWKRLTS
jgi:ribosomal protein S18 acetylase RimI-like enzyme